MIEPERLIPAVAILGAIVGSFLNVVIYRLPRGLSIHQPRWSFCPMCGHTIRWFDNLPIVGWLLLHGRCRDCRSPIAVTYPLVECLAALLFVSAWDAVLVGRQLPPIGTTAAPLAVDWPVALAYFALFAGLLALSGMDLEAYTINIEVCIFVMVAAPACLAVAAGLRSASGAGGLPIPTPLPPLLGAAGLAMGAAWAATAGILALVARRSGRAADESPPEGPTARDDEAAEEAGEEAGGSTPPPATPRFQPLPVVLLALFIAGLMVWQMLAASSGVVQRLDPSVQRGILATAMLFLVLILCSMIHREADQMIIEEIEAERASARRTALRELATFLPAIGAGVLVFMALRGTLAATDDWITWTSRRLGSGWANAAAAAAMASVGACVWAAAIGWSVRILGTLAFGKEAFGSGDIYILGAIGAVGGLWFTLFAFLFSVGLALLGVLATVFHKRSRAIPFGPWLALGSFFALFAFTPLITYFSAAAAFLWSLISGIPVY